MIMNHMRRTAATALTLQMMPDLSPSARGAARSAAMGLSYCSLFDFSCEEMEAYAHNCPSPHFLALLDAISP